LRNCRKTASLGAAKSAESLLLFGAALAAFTLLSSAAEEIKESSSDLYRKGTQALDAGEPKESVTQFERALKLQPDNVLALRGLILANLAAGRTASALNAADRLLRILQNNGGEFAVAISTARALAQHNQFVEAEEFLKLAQQSAPPLINGRASSVFFEQVFANLSASMHKQDEAIERLEHLVQSDIDEPEHYYELGLLLIQSSRFATSYEVMREASAKFPKSFEIQLGYALSCYFTGRNEDAEKAYRQIVAWRPDAAEPYFALGNFYADTGRDEEAVNAFQRAAQLDPKSYLNHYMYGAELFRMGNIEQAAIQLKRATELNPRHADSYYWLGKIQLRQSRPDAALQSFEKAVSLEAKHIGAYYQLALLYQRRGETEKARRALEIRADLTHQMHEGIVADRMSQ
jgi:tetratricopeptide (TPR) repeat protein